MFTPITTLQTSFQYISDLTKFEDFVLQKKKVLVGSGSVLWMWCGPGSSAAVPVVVTMGR